MNTRDTEDGVLNRWAKRKAEVQKELDLEENEAAEAEVEAELVEPETEEAALDVLRERDPELAEKIAGIDVDKMEYEDDFSIFMNKKVPEFLRRRALSKLWLSNPILANVDGLNDYDEDFTIASSVVDELKSALVSGNGEVVSEDGVDETEDEIVNDEAKDPGDDLSDAEVEQVAEHSEAEVLEQVSTENETTT